MNKKFRTLIIKMIKYTAHHSNSSSLPYLRCKKQAQKVVFYSKYICF